MVSTRAITLRAIDSYAAHLRHGRRCIWRNTAAPPPQFGTSRRGGESMSHAIQRNRLPANPASASAARRWRIGGRVQGVGFRPFVYRLAHVYELTGWVRNTGGEVEIHGEGTLDRLEVFGCALLSRAPPAGSRAFMSP